MNASFTGDHGSYYEASFHIGSTTACNGRLPGRSGKTSQSSARARWIAENARILRRYIPLRSKHWIFSRSGPG